MITLGGDGHLAPVSRSNSPSLLDSTYIILGSPTFVTRGVRLAGYRFQKRLKFGEQPCHNILVLKLSEP